MKKMFQNDVSVFRQRIKKFLLVMKLTILLTMVLTLAVSAGTYSQNTKLDLALENVPIERALLEIENHSRFVFIYESGTIDKTIKRTISVKDQTIDAILLQLLDGTDVKYSIDDRQVLLYKDGSLQTSLRSGNLSYDEQSKTITGKVTDSVGAPLPGVSVVIKGTTIGIITDLNGVYALAKVPSDAILVFSFVGMKTQEIKVAGKNSINVKLEEETIGIEEVVAVGYSVQKKSSLTGSVSMVDEKTLENKPVSNALDALQSTAPGLVVSRTSGEPGLEGWNMNIRGFSSLNGTNQPLVIVDGVEGDLTQLNPNDIQSVSVLKDAAAAAIYGAKSSNGVVIVTTKKAEKKVSVDYTGLFTTKTPYGMPDLVHTYEWAEMQNVANANAGLNPSWSQEQIDWFRDDSQNVVLNSSDQSKIGFYYDLDLKKLLLRSSTPSQNHNISVTGGNNQTRFLFSAGYYDQSGVFKYGPDETKRYNFRLNLSTELTKAISLESRLSYSQSKTESPSVAVAGRWGLMHQILAFSMGRQPFYLPGYEGTYYLDQGTNHPYAQLKDGGYKNSGVHDFSGVFTLKANVTKGLTVRAVYSPDLTQRNIDTFVREMQMYTFKSDGTPTLARTINSPNSITKTRATQLSQEIQGLIDYDLSIANDHHLHLLGGYQYKDFRYDYTSAQAKSLLSNDQPSLNFLGDPTVKPVVGDDIEKNTWSSFFGRFNYDYKEKYYLEATVRNDASSRLAPGYRSQSFPALSVAYRLTKEPWFKSSFRFLDEFKLRASWGKLGNAQLGANTENNYNYVAQLTQATPYPFNNTSNATIYQKTLASPSMGWETIETTDGGADISLLKYRLNLSFDYFYRKNNNMLISINQPAVLGVDPSTVNGAAMKSWGWEVTIGWKDKIKSVNYSVNFNIDDSQNEITRYDGNVAYTAGVNTAIPGCPINSIFGYKADGYFSSKEEVSSWAFQNTATGAGDIKYIDQNNDKSINTGRSSSADHGDLVYLGNLSPRYNFGFNLNLEWKGIDFSAFFNGTGKRNFLIESNIRVPFLVGYNPPWAIHKDYWTPENTDAKFPRLYSGGAHNNVISSFWVQNAAYLRLKNLQIGYTFPERLTEKVKIKKARIFFTGQDLWEENKMWFNVFDAEYPNNAGYTYPFFRSYAFGLNLTF